MGKPLGKKDFDQISNYLTEQEANLRRYASWETASRDRQLAPQRGQLEAILQGMESIVVAIRFNEYIPGGPVTQKNLDDLAERAAQYTGNARRLLNQPQDRYKPDAKGLCG